MYRAGQLVPAHNHAAPAVILLVSGRCTLRNNLRRHLHCSPGAAIVHPAGELHSYRYEADSDSQMLAISLPAQYSDRFRARVDLNARGRTRPGSRADDLGVRRRVEQPHTSALSLETTVFEFLGELCGTREELSVMPSPATVRDLLHDRFREPLSSAEIARIVDLSRILLARHFRRQFRL
jgi:hypothetical protein